jgi:hypothetical protein
VRGHAEHDGAQQHREQPTDHRDEHLARSPRHTFVAADECGRASTVRLERTVVCPEVALLDLEADRKTPSALPSSRPKVISIDGAHSVKR